MTNVNGILFFVGVDGRVGGLGRELWKSDGTESGTVLVKDIWSGDGGWPHTHLTNVNGTLYFSGNDGTAGEELWKSDGTEIGTVLVNDILPGTLDSDPFHLTNVDGTLFFRARDDKHGYEVWKTDGSESGTALVKDIWPGISQSDPRDLQNINGTLFFNARDAVGRTLARDLWISDGSTEGTILVTRLSSESIPTIPLTLVGNTLYFVVDDRVFGRELWKLTLQKADAGGPYTIQEGQTITLDASGSSPEASFYEWDLDNNGSFETVGQTVSFTADDNGIFHVPLRVTGPTGTAFDSATIEVENLPPIARVGGVLAGFTDLPSNLRLFADDPSPVDQAAGFDFEVDFDGDGAVDDVLHGSSGLLVSHTFAASDVYQVLVTAVDKDGGRSNTASHRVVIIDAVREADAEQPALTNLVWTGTNGDDHVVFTQTSATTVLIELHQLNGVPLSPSFRAYMFGINGRVIADGLAGYDLIDLSGVNTISAEIHGGDGQDTIFGTQAADVIYANGPTNTGGDGAEGDGGEGRPGSHVYGGGGDDVLFGARGRDYLDAGTGRNLIHAGRDGAEGRDTLIGASAPDLSPQSDDVLLTAPAKDAFVDELTALGEVLANWDDDATSPVWPT